MDSLVPTNAPVNSEDTFAVLKTFIEEIIGEDFKDEIDIRRDSSFTADLELDSIEIVAFSEKVKLHFGSKLDFTGWLSNMDLDGLIALKLSDVIEYIEACR